MPSSNASPPNYETLTDVHGPIAHEPCSEMISLGLENRQSKLMLDASVWTVNSGIIIDRLCEYILLLRNMEAKHLHAEAKYQELERMRHIQVDALSTDMQALRETCEKSKAETHVLRNELEQMKEGPSLSSTLAALNIQQNTKITEECAQTTTISTEKLAIDLEFKPVDRSPEDMIKTRFDILAQLPVPADALVDVLKPIGIPERFTLHEFLLGSASGSLKNALSGYCAFTENTTMWCPQREEHGFYLTPLYKCDTGPRSNVIHRWVQVDVKARMPKPTGKDHDIVCSMDSKLINSISPLLECFFRKNGEWYYTGTYQPLRLEDLTPKEYENLSQSARDALVKETLAGRKNTTPQIFFETSQLYAAGALKVAVVGIQCVGFNRMLYSVALQQAQRFQNSRRGKITPENDALNLETL